VIEYGLPLPLPFTVRNHHRHLLLFVTVAVSLQNVSVDDQPVPEDRLYAQSLRPEADHCDVVHQRHYQTEVEQEPKGV